MPNIYNKDTQTQKKEINKIDIEQKKIEGKNKINFFVLYYLYTYTHTICTIFLIAFYLYPFMLEYLFCAEPFIWIYLK